MQTKGSSCAYIGFDSAWTDNPRAPGAICGIVFRPDAAPVFHQPRLATFADALSFIRELQAEARMTLVALDQPTVVPNLTSLRPVERVAASLISWLGGGVQPSNRGRAGMFCDASPIWSFLRDLNAVESPEAMRNATEGLFLIEVFPAIAMPTLSPEFFGRLSAPRYNPGRRKTFKPVDWGRVASALTSEYQALGFPEAANWAEEAGKLSRVTKADQDRLDAMVCLWILLHWQLRPREQSLLIGNSADGYMVIPASADVKLSLTAAASKIGVPLS